MRQAFAVVASRSMRAFRSLSAVLLAAAVGVAAAAPASANAKYAAIVVDANTGQTLFASNADAPRFPASLTKMMTLYLTFEALKAGKISKSTRISFSAQAAAKPPTKLGVGAGKSVTVETAILALVTKSANDAAAALAEHLGGSEQRFALMMTQKARRLGMSGTTFRNASGLPDPAQRTTARDMATLGVALREHFPQYYSYFATRSFTLGKRKMANHNRLLGRVKGVDGIKTGYTRASGFNLVSSVVDGNRRIVAVVMGGTSGRARDDHMASLITKYLPEASSRRGGALVARGDATSFDAITAPTVVATADETPKPAMRPLDVDTEVAEAVTTAKSSRLSRTKSMSRPEPAAPVAVDPIETASVAPSGWAVQVASSPSETEAKSALAAVGSKAGSLLASAAPYTTRFQKGGTTYYRARFGGFASKSAAWNACGALKKKRISCYAVQQ